MMSNPLQVSFDLPIDPGHSAARPRLMSLIYPPAGWSSNYRTLCFTWSLRQFSCHSLYWKHSWSYVHCSCRGDQSNAFYWNEFVIIGSAADENWWLLLWQPTTGEICHWTTSQYSSVMTICCSGQVIKMKQNHWDEWKARTILDCNVVDGWHWQWGKMQMIRTVRGRQSEITREFDAWSMKACAPQFTTKTALQKIL